MDKTEILIVEDDEEVRQGLIDILNGSGYFAWPADNTEKAWMLFHTKNIRCILLDICLDGESGYDLCKKIRSESEVPILFLTACDSEMDLVRGFKVGGDDYITKPFRIQELLVRIQALLRRTKSNEGRELYYSEDFIFDGERNHLYCGLERIELTPVELRLVRTLLFQWPKAVSREQILYYVWDRDSEFVEENTLNVNISRLREKLGAVDGTSYIETIRGVGYRWTTPVRK